MGSNVEWAGSTGNVVSHSGAVGAYTSALLGGGEGRAGVREASSKSVLVTVSSQELGVTDLLCFAPVYT